jgi:hypothetical protein
MQIAVGFICILQVSAVFGMVRSKMAKQGNGAHTECFTLPLSAIARFTFKS